MKPLVKTFNDPKSVAEAIDAWNAKPDAFFEKMVGHPITPEERAALIKEALDSAADEVWANDIYTVHMRKLGNGALGQLVHLSLKRNDRAPITDWRDKQDIKNQLCGEDAEGLELYPAESRVVDTSNQYHLWVFVGGPGISIGFPTGFKTEETIARSKQRAFKE